MHALASATGHPPPRVTPNLSHAFGGFGFLGGFLTSRYIIIGLAYGVVIEVGVGQIPTQLSKLSMTHQVQGMLQSLLLNGEKLVAANGNNAPDATVLGTITLLLG